MHLYLEIESFQMLPQMACLNESIVALVTYICLFTLRFQMSIERDWIRAGIVTLVAFVLLFSTVRCQMCPQIACHRRCLVTFLHL